MATDKGRSQRFFANVLWGWLGVFAALLSGLLLTPYLIAKLGDTRYGIWALAFAFLEYLRLLDFGSKTALVHFIAKNLPERRYERINQGISTVFFFCLGLGMAAAAPVVIFSGQLWRVFNIAPELRPEFQMLTVAVGINCAVALAFNVFQGALEAFQEFKTINRLLAISMFFRGAISFAVLYWGYGVVAVGVVTVSSQLLNQFLQYLALRRAFPQLRISYGLVHLSLWYETLRFGKPALLAGLGSISLNQTPLLLVGRSLPEAFVGYYTFPNRLLQYGVELVTRIGFVTMPNTTELAARGATGKIMSLGMHLNRYCLALFMPLSLFLLCYGGPLIAVWIDPAFAAQAGPLVPAFVLATSLAVAAQFNSSVILFGIAKHNAYARSLIVEAVLSAICMVLVLPRFGLPGVAWVAAVFAILNRGILTPALLCHTLGFRFIEYMRSIYLAPLAVALPVSALAWGIQATVLPGRSWTELVMASALIAIPYYAVGYFAVMEPHHRAVVWRSAAALAQKLRPLGSE